MPILSFRVTPEQEDALERLTAEVDAGRVRRTRGFARPARVVRDLIALLEDEDLPARGIRPGRGRPRGAGTVGLRPLAVQVTDAQLRLLDRWAAAEGHATRGAAVRALIDLLLVVRPDLRR
jgi:hypothetical protein